MGKGIWIAPSVLAADFRNLGAEARRAEAAGADALHVDVMDGMFVPNISFGMPVVRALRDACSLPLDVHLMVQEPGRYIDAFAEAGAAFLTVHLEACTHLDRTLQDIRAHRVCVGIALNPATPVNALECVLGEIDLLLIMTVNPGFGGQKLIPYALEKIARARAMLDAIGSSARLEVDGGLSAVNVREFTSRGADMLVSGTSLFKAEDMASEIARLRRA